MIYTHRQYRERYRGVRYICNAHYLFGILVWRTCKPIRKG